MTEPKPVTINYDYLDQVQEETEHSELTPEQVEANRGPVPTDPPISPAPEIHPSEFPKGRRGTMPGVEIRGERK